MALVNLAKKGGLNDFQILEGVGGKRGWFFLRKIDAPMVKNLKHESL